MNTITAIRHSPIDRSVNVVADETGITVKLCSGNETDTFYIDDVYVDDIELLSIMFQYEQVCVFKIIVELIGYVMRARDKT